MKPVTKRLNPPLSLFGKLVQFIILKEPSISFWAVDSVVSTCLPTTSHTRSPASGPPLLLLPASFHQTMTSNKGSKCLLGNPDGWLRKRVLLCSAEGEKVSWRWAVTPTNEAKRRRNEGMRATSPFPKHADNRLLGTNSAQKKETTNNYFMDDNFGISTLEIKKAFSLGNDGKDPDATCSERRHRARISKAHFCLENTFSQINKFPGSLCLVSK